MENPGTRRLWARVNMVCALHMANGGLSPDTRPRSWFFEVPAGSLSNEFWQELLPRIFYDLNVSMRRREPGDAAWIAVESFEVFGFHPQDILFWNGSSPLSLPWVGPDRNKVWEQAVCYFVDDSGRYDIMSSGDFTELLLNRLLQCGTIDSARFIDFLNKFHKEKEPAAGKRIHDNAAQRLQNLITVRTTAGAYRKSPGSRPFECGPVNPVDL